MDIKKSLYRDLDIMASTETTKDALNRLLAERGVLLADGATGTNLFNMGLASGEAPELWNEGAPDKIRELHRGFVEAGADIILTNSFGGTRQRLKLHNAEDRVFEINKRAAELAREIADAAPRDVLVAGSAVYKGNDPATYAGRIKAIRQAASLTA